MTARLIGKSILGLALAASVSTAAMADDIRLKLAGTWPAKHFGNEILENMVEEIENAGVGIKVSYFPASQLGSGEELVEDAIRGNVDIVQAFLYAQTDPRLEILNLPAMVTTFEELQAVYGDPDSKLNTILSGIMAEHGLVSLGLVGEGLIGIVASEKPTDHAGFGDKGVNIRVWSSDIAKKTTESLGYRTTTMNWAEVLPALQSGVIDGAICCTPEWAYTTFAVADVGKYYIPVNTFIEASALYASQKTWDKMNDEQRSVVRAAIEKASSAAIDKAWERSQGFMDQMVASGYEILDYTAEERAAMVSHIRENVWPDLAGVIGQDIMDELTAE